MICARYIKQFAPTFLNTLLRKKLLLTLDMERMDHTNQKKTSQKLHQICKISSVPLKRYIHPRNGMLSSQNLHPKLYKSEMIFTPQQIKTLKKPAGMCITEETFANRV